MAHDQDALTATDRIADNINNRLTLARSRRTLHHQTRCLPRAEYGRLLRGVGCRGEITIRFGWRCRQLTARLHHAGANRYLQRGALNRPHGELLQIFRDCLTREVGMEKNRGGVELDLPGGHAHRCWGQWAQPRTIKAALIARRFHQGRERHQRIEDSLEIKMIAAAHVIEHLPPCGRETAQQTFEGGIDADFIALRIERESNGPALARRHFQAHRPKQHRRNARLGRFARTGIAQRHKWKAEVERIDASIATVGRSVLTQTPQALLALRIGQQRRRVECHGLTLAREERFEDGLGGSSRTGKFRQIQPRGRATDSHAHQTAALQTGDETPVEKIEDVSDILLARWLAPFLGTQRQQHQRASERDAAVLSKVVCPLIRGFATAAHEVAQTFVQRVEDFAAALLKPWRHPIARKRHLRAGGFAFRFVQHICRGTERIQRRRNEDDQIFFGRRSPLDGGCKRGLFGFGVKASPFPPPRLQHGSRGGEQSCGKLSFVALDAGLAQPSPDAIRALAQSDKPRFTVQPTQTRRQRTLQPHQRHIGVTQHPRGRDDFST